MMPDGTTVCPMGTEWLFVFLALGGCQWALDAIELQCCETFNGGCI